MFRETTIYLNLANVSKENSKKREIHGRQAALRSCRESKLACNLVSSGLKHSFLINIHFNVRSLLQNIMSQPENGGNPSSRRQIEKDRESELVLTVLQSYREPRDRLIFRNRIASTIPLELALRSVFSFFFYPLSRGKEKFPARLHDRHTGGGGGRGASCERREKGETTGKLVLHYKAGGPWQWGTPRA